MKKLLCKPIGHYGLWDVYLDDEKEPKEIIIECTYCGKQYKFELSDKEIDLSNLMFSRR